MRIHHTAICTSDIELSLRFWRDGLGFSEQMDERFEGDWPALFNAPQPALRSVFLGDPTDSTAGILELVEFEGGVGAASAPSPVPSVGFFLVSVYLSVDNTLAQLERLGMGGPPTRIALPGPVHMAVVHDPNGVKVELIDTSPRH